MPQKTKITIGIIALLVFVATIAVTAKIAYYLGERHISELILHSDVPDADDRTSTTTNPATSDNEALLRDQLNRLMNDYESACYNYQALYEAYDLLYAQAGAASSQQKIVRPDSARGNAVSCYR